MTTLSPNPAELTSVVVACLGSTAATKRCLAALLRHTDIPWELVTVTRGRSDATTAYLEGVRDASTTNVRMVTMPECRHVRDAWARGLRASQGSRIALLRDSVVVTDAWLRQLVALGRVGSLGPIGAMTRVAAGEGPIADDLSDLAGLDAFAARFRSERRGRWMTVDAVRGGCVLVDRGLVGGEGVRPIRAGGLRPRRLAALAKRLGREPAVVLDLYLHDEAIRRRPARPLRLSGMEKPTGELPPASPGRSRRVSLTMIVRNEEANLPACLESAANLFDEIVIVDTGSTDQTVEIARSFGARVFEFPWIDDFAAARNAALSHASGDYAFWLDADDRVESAERDRLRKLFDGLQAPDVAFVVRCACDADPSGGGSTVVDHIRLFPLRHDVRWSYRVHEQILPALRRAGVAVRWSDATVRHVGYNDPVIRARKLDRDRAILEREAAERPDEPFILFNLGQIAAEQGDRRAALDYFRRSLAGSAPTDSITRKLYALIALCHQRLGDSDAAMISCSTGLSVYPEDAELLFRRGILHRLRGEPSEAESCWRRVLTLQQPERFSSLDVGIYGHVTRRNLARLAEERGDQREAARQWTAILGECPGDGEASAALASSRLVGIGQGGLR